MRSAKSIGAWKQATSELAYERSGPERFLETYYVLTELVRALGPNLDTRGAEGIGRLVAQLHSMRRMSVSVAGMLQAGKEPVVEAFHRQGHRHHLGAAASASRSRPCRLYRRRCVRTIIRLRISWPSPSRSAPKLTIQGGTTEVLRGIIARGLGLR